MINGSGVSEGIVIGTVKALKEVKIDIKKNTIEHTEDEHVRFYRNLKKSETQIKTIYDKTLKEVGKEEAEIFNAHLVMLNDTAIITETLNIVDEENVNIEYAYDLVTKKYIEMFKNIPDPYIQERAIDLKDVSLRVLKNLLSIEDKDYKDKDKNIVLIAKDLTPSDTAQMDKQSVVGFITELGGSTSHTAIIARTLEIPAICGVDNIFEQISENQTIIMDGQTGEIILDPDENTLEIYSQKRDKLMEEKQIYRTYASKRTQTLDGKSLEIAANIGTVHDLEMVIKNGAEGIGLFRTELFYLDREKLPTEEDQYEVYKEVLTKMGDKPVVIRTLDIGGDKEIPYLDIPKEANPFLGYRAIRVCLDQVDIFKTQLRALLKASVYGNLKIMFPMISSLSELRAAKSIVEEVKEQLYQENQSYNESVELGMMIEIPAAAIMSDMFAKEVDFFSIGTNDLIQYTVAVDRGNTKISSLYTEYNPAVLRLINMVIENGHKENIWVGMCGEVASNPSMIPLLLAMGLDEFSMNSSMIPRSRYILNNLSQVETQHLREVLNMDDAQVVRGFLESR